MLGDGLVGLEDDGDTAEEGVPLSERVAPRTPSLQEWDFLVRAGSYPAFHYGCPACHAGGVAGESNQLAVGMWGISRVLISGAGWGPSVSGFSRSRARTQNTVKGLFPCWSPVTMATGRYPV